jgi:signal transduction histidine kinase
MKRDLETAGLSDAKPIPRASVVTDQPPRLPSGWNLALLWGLTFLLIVVPAWRAAPPWPQNEPEEGFYWAAAQYEIRLGQLREQLIVVANDDADGTQARNAFAEAQQRAGLLDSKAKLLTEPSQLQSLLQSLTGYEEAAPGIKALQMTLRIDMQSPNMSAAEARSLIAEIDRVMPAVIRLSDEARVREVRGRSELYATFQEQQRIRGVYVVIIWFLLCAAATWIWRGRLHERHQAKRLQEALDAEKEARGLLDAEIAAKGRFASIVNHELRSPLQVVVSSLSQLGQEIPPSERSNALARMQRASQMMETQLSDLAVLARGGLEPLKLEPVSFEAAALVEDVANVQRPSALKKGLGFHAEVPNEPVFVVADAQRISQIVTNLTSNAIRCTRDGWVRVQLRTPAVDASSLEIVVADTGPGLPAAQLRRLRGEPDAQDAAVLRRDGTGIGLTIVETVVSNLGGTLHVHSSPGFGTRITVSIPVEFEDVDGIPERPKA